MAEIVFVRTGHHYDSYTDLFRLAELSSFPIIPISEVDISQHKIFILAPHNGGLAPDQGEWNPHINNQKHKERNAHLVLWCLERPSGSKGSVGEYGEANRGLLYNRYFDEIWVSDSKLADETHLRHVVLGSDYGLGEPSNNKMYDFVHMSAIVPRRDTIYSRLGYDRLGPNCWPPDRDKVLKQSKFALNIHQDNHPFQEPLRFALFAAYGLPIISETLIEAYPFSGEFMIFAGYDTIVKRANDVLRSDYTQWHEMGERARKRMCEEFQFGKMVRQAVWESTEKWR
jgi:hypothetical protein